MWPRGHLCQRPQSCFRFWRQLAKVAASPADTGWGSRLVKREMWPAAGRRHPNGLQRLLVVTSASASASGAHSVLSREPPAARLLHCAAPCLLRSLPQQRAVPCRASEISISNSWGIVHSD